jgi:predicted DNA binding protein
MWIAKLKLSHKGDIFTERTKKFNVKFYGYPLTHYIKGNKAFFVVNGFLAGEEKNKRAFLSDLKKDRRIVNLETKKDYMNVLINYPNDEITRTDMNTFYDSAIIHVEPILNDIDGFEYWTIASFEKTALQKLILSAKKIHNGKLLMMVSKKFDDFYIVNIRPKISDKQKKTIIKALEEGYYEYPRRLDITELANMLKISYSTCQEHLRKAELALLPSMIKKL